MFGVTLGEVAAAKQGDLHGRKKVGADGIDGNIHLAVRAIADESLDPHVTSAAAIIEEHVIRGRRGDHAGQSSNALLDKGKEIVESGRFVPGPRRIQSNNEHIVLVKAWVDMPKVYESAHEEAGGEQEQERNSHLHDDERFAQSEAQSKSAAGLRVLF
jgi:hypothetical protein